MKQLFFFFLFFCSALSAGSVSEQEASLAQEAEPSSFVGNVNAIFGTFHQSGTDLVVPGPTPLHLTHSYSSDSFFENWMGRVAMSTNFPTRIIASPFSKEKSGELSVEESTGSFLKYVTKSDGKKRVYTLDPKVLQKGLTNNGTGAISARTNLKNSRYIMEISEHSSEHKVKWSAEFGDGTFRKYHSLHLKKEFPDEDDEEEEKPKEDEFLRYIRFRNRQKREVANKEKPRTATLDYEWRPNGNHLFYRYDEDEQLRAIKTTSEDENDTLNWLHFDYDKDKKRAVVKSSNGKWCEYHFMREKAGKVGRANYVRKIASSDTSNVHFDYSKYGDKYLLTRIDFADGRFLEVDYDDKGRVKWQKAPAGKEGKKERIFEFEYRDQETRVSDANGNRRIFRFGKSKRLKEIEDSVKKLRFYWGKKETHDQGHLMAKVLLNHSDKAISSYTYSYDQYGNIIKETLYGALTGKSSKGFTLDEAGRPKEAVEHFRRYYRYSDDRFHLLVSQSEDDGPEIVYEYKKGRDLVSAKFTKYNDRIQMREFFEYDKTGTLVLKIIDDGSSRHDDNLHGVTERRITKIEPVEKRGEYGVGQPKIVSEYYLDLESKKRILIGRKEYSYNQAGLVTREKIYNSHDEAAYTLVSEYDGRGRLTASVDAIGRRTEFGYDDNNNKTYEHLIGSHMSRSFCYDKMNRLIEEKEDHRDGRSFVKRYEYDATGNRTASIDHFGLETRYSYDALNRLVKTTLPAIQGVDAPIVKQEYDLQNNVIAQIDANKNEVKTAYNSRKQPVIITYADGAKEEFEYNLNGTLKQKWDKAGARTVYSYDWQRRPTKVEVFSRDNKLISSTKNRYNVFHIIATVDPMGVETRYSYDGAGREVEVTKKEKRTTHRYDSLGRKIATKEWYGDGEKECLITAQILDLAGRTIKESRETGDGVLLASTSYTYDIFDNKIKISIAREAELASEQQFVYNSSSQLIEAIDEYGEKTKTIYNYAFKNSIGQRVLQKITLDPLGNSVVETYNSRQQLSSMRQYDRHEKLLSATKFRYDAHGNKILETHDVLIDGSFDHTYEIAFAYDSQHRLVEQKEEGKCTSYAYAKSGFLRTITKPDGVTLNHSYDDLGRLLALTSADKTISYAYQYDLNGNPILVQDHVHGETQMRSFDSFNRVTKENFGRYTIGKSYDALGRMREFQLPDQSGVSYRYKGGQLSSVIRLDAAKKERYRHSYTAVDLKGAVLKADSIAGEFSYTWDRKGRLRELKTPFWSEALTSYDKAGNLTERTLQDAVSKTDCSYSYDSLYQLASESGPVVHSYAYDSISNRLKKDQISYEVDQKNRLKKAADIEYSYDKNGNLIKKRENGLTTHYCYDALDRLIQVEDPQSFRVTYLYDSLHRRINKRLYRFQNGSFHESALEEYFYYGDREVGAYVNGVFTQFRMLGRSLGGDVGAAVALELNSALYCPIHDHRGNITALVDAERSVVETIRYSSFGEAMIFDAANQPQAKSISPWLFASKRYEQETGFSYFGRRYFSSQTGRWITPDPIGFSDGPNLYAFVHNRPHVFLDLTGLFSDGSPVAPHWATSREWVGEDMPVNPAFVGKRYDQPNYERELYNRIISREPEFAARHLNTENYFSRTQNYINQGSGNFSYSMMNGINTTCAGARSHVEYLSKLIDNVDVTLTYNATHGIWEDMREYNMNADGVNTTPSYMLKEEWENFVSGHPWLNKMHYCHSHGVTVTRNALEMCSEEVQKRVIVVAIAPGSYISKKICKDVRHIVNGTRFRDFIPYLDTAGRKLAEQEGTIEYVDSVSGTPKHDHDFQSRTYREPIRAVTQTFRQKYGGS